MNDWFFWIGILLWVDGSIGLLFLAQLRRRVKRIDVLRLAWVEIICGGILLCLYALLRSRG